MCSGAILLAHICQVVWLISNADHGALNCLHKDLQGRQKPLLSAFYQNRMDSLTISCIDWYNEALGYKEVKERSEAWKSDMMNLMNEWTERKKNSSPEELLCRESFLQQLLSPVYAIVPVLKFSR